MIPQEVVVSLGQLLIERQHLIFNDLVVEQQRTVTLDFRSKVIRFGINHPRIVFEYLSNKGVGLFAFL
jgi:hypothetical protein